MSSDNFPLALKRVLVSEGGKVDDPLDPGGRTAYGVTQRVFSAWLRNQKLPVVDVYTIDQVEVASIYRLQYWNKIHGDDLPAGVDYVVFDAAINSGSVQAVKWLQRALRMNAVDGILGQATLAALTADEDNDALIARYSAARLTFMKHLKTWGRFGKGWSDRVAHVLTVGQELASGSVDLPAPVYFLNGERKADIADAKPMPSVAAASAVTSGGAVSAGAATALNSLQPVGSLSPVVGSILTAATAGLVVIGVLGGGYIWWAKRKTAERAAALDLPSAAPTPAPEPEAVPDAAPASA